MDQTGLDVADVVEDVGTVHGGRRKGERGLLLGEGRRGLLRERGACCDWEGGRQRTRGHLFQTGEMRPG